MKLYFVYLIAGISYSLQSCGQKLFLEGDYVYKDLSKKTDLQNGTTFKLNHDKTAFINTYYHITGQKTYKGKWLILNNDSLAIFDLQDINGIQPLNRIITIDTIQSKNNKAMMIVINDDGKFTDFFPAKLTINDTAEYFLKSGDTLFLKSYNIEKITVKVEDFEDSVNVTIDRPMLIKISVKNNTKGSLYYYFKDILLQIKKGKFYYNGIRLSKISSL